MNRISLQIDREARFLSAMQANNLDEKSGNAIMAPLPPNSEKVQVELRLSDYVIVRMLRCRIGGNRVESLTHERICEEATV
jgi:hypothetical protein